MAKENLHFFAYYLRNLLQYYYIQLDLSNHSCSFLTASGNKWDVSIPSRTLISLKDKKPTLNDAKNSNNTDTFIIPFEVIRGNLKIMFNKSDNDTDTRAAISKTLSFINE